MEPVYFGICCSAHDPAIAIINMQGELVFAEAAERSLQYKRGLNTIADHYPYIDKLMKQYMDDNNSLVVAKSWSKQHHRNIKLAKSFLSLFNPILRLFPVSKTIAERYGYMLKLQSHVFSFSGQILMREWKEKHFAKDGFRFLNNRLSQRYYNHHLCHAMSAAFASPYEEAVVAVIDGYGQNTSTGFYHFKNGMVSPVQGIRKSKNSLGFFYSFLCAACGFNPDLGEEWKVMGLAPYGKVVPELYEKLEKLIPVIKGRFANPGFGFDIALYDKIISRAIATDGPPYDVKDIACTGQQIFEDKMMESLNYLHKITGGANLVLAGGCALNSSCNGKIKERTPFSNVYVYCAPGDDGTAVGAALLAFLKDNPVSAVKRGSFFSPYKGAPIEGKALQKSVENSPYCYHVGDKKSAVAAKLISEGHIIGWVQGHAEFGPRALGNRSILADPRNPDIKDIINRKLKYREGFRPFAPSILEEYGTEIFDDYQPSYYMDKTLRIKDSYWQKIPGVSHVNQTGRLQTVTKELNPAYYDLISAFYKLTGVPVVLNTSFNLSGKPIVHSMDDIMASLYTSGLTAVVVNDYLFTKEPYTPEI
jgi:carbamoyltransferase